MKRFNQLSREEMRNVKGATGGNSCPTDNSPCTWVEDQEIWVGGCLGGSYPECICRGTGGWGYSDQCTPGS